MARNWADVISKLFEKANDETVPETEREALVERAMFLMSEKGISDAMLASAGQMIDTIINKKMVFENPYGTTKRDLYCCLGLAFRCKVVQLQDKRTLHIFGYKSDIDKVDDLFSYLLLFGASELKAAMLTRDPFNSSLKSFTVQFWKGFMYRVMLRLTDMNKQATAAAQSANPGTEVVLVDRKAKVSSAMAVAYPRTRNTTISRARGTDGYYAGQSAGNKVGLSNSASVGGRRGISG